MPRALLDCTAMQLLAHLGISGTLTEMASFMQVTKLAEEKAALQQERTTMQRQVLPCTPHQFCIRNGTYVLVVWHFATECLEQPIYSQKLDTCHFQVLQRPIG